MGRGHKRKKPESGVISQKDLRTKIAKLQKFMYSKKKTGKKTK